MEAKFIGDPRNNFEGPGSIELQGVTFPYDQWVKVDPASAVARKVAASDHFETRADKPATPKAEKPAA